ncbi:MAG: hypothetical protein HQ559_01675 [Lentisphaerae bacterium]|nr:hypothetical protein [Lentisphaerota bacterium]
MSEFWPELVLRSRLVDVLKVSPGPVPPCGVPVPGSTMTPTPKLKFRKSGLSNFVSARNKLPGDKLAFLTPYTEAEYKQMGARVFLTNDGLSGFAIKKNGELVSVFSNARGRGAALVQDAVDRGATRLDCLGEHLRELYKDRGFKVTKTIHWSDDYAPASWDYEKYGRPDVYEMTLRRKGVK